ncbi:MAG: carbon-nitrogen family hydrolase [Phycisphaerae bacterium]|nr:carbon-nitrogen family hydrolase [Phycisphaerae bacterium]
MHAHLLQLDIQWEDPAANRDRVARLIGQSPITPGDLILLPEMFDTGFSVNTAVTADRTGASQHFITRLAAQTRSTVVAGITVIDPQGRPRNRAVVAGPDGAIVANYDKSRLFPLGSPSEADLLTPGDSPVLFDWNGLAVSPLICYDLRFPELFAQALKIGAQAFAVIANWPVDRAAHWRALLIARAIETQSFVFGVNRVGRDPNLTYSGGSIGVDPLGIVLAEAGPVEQVLSISVDPGKLTAWRARFPAWKARI